MAYLSLSTKVTLLRGFLTEIFLRSLIFLPLSMVAYIFLTIDSILSLMRASLKFGIYKKWIESAWRDESYWIPFLRF